MPPVWKWIDSSGQVQFSDLPPPLSVPDKDILERPPLQRRAAANAASAASAAAALPIGAPRTDPELEMQRQRAAQDPSVLQRQQQERDAAVRADNCHRARKHLAALGDGIRMTRSNAQGEREVLDDTARADEMQRARGVIAADCR